MGTFYIGMGLPADALYKQEKKKKDRQTEKNLKIESSFSTPPKHKYSQ